MKKSDLKNGMFVRYRKGDWNVVVDDKIIGINGWNPLDAYTDDMSCVEDGIRLKSLDIVAVSKAVSFKEARREREKAVIWRRPKEILDNVEKAYLSAVIKPFRNRVEYIEKIRMILEPDKECLALYLNEYGPMVFPVFAAETMYKGMSRNKRYTLEELGL